jgi:hypothetical protein
MVIQAEHAMGVFDRPPRRQTAFLALHITHSFSANTENLTELQIPGFRDISIQPPLFPAPAEGLASRIHSAIRPLLHYFFTEISVRL